ncbi:MAG: hypothetical protein AB8G16_00455 [Gammaproteobacteria bacterium]
MRKTSIILLLAMLCGCTGSQVKNTVAAVPGALVRGALENGEVSRSVERCKAENPGTAAHCGRERARNEYRQAALDNGRERARAARQDSREQQDQFEEAWDSEQSAAASLTADEQIQLDDAFLDGLSEDLSESLKEPLPTAQEPTPL